MEYTKVKKQIMEKLPAVKTLGDQENLLELGLNSLMIMRLVNLWRKQGVKVAFGDLMETPTLEEWWQLIQRGKSNKSRAANEVIRIKKTIKAPFPLTDVQYAYWAGRNDDQVLGGIGCHAYFEFDGEGVEAGKLNKAWNQLQYHHPMLRARFLEDGTQEIMDTPYSGRIRMNDFSQLTAGTLEEALENVRKRMSHRKLQIEKGEVAGAELSIMPEGRTRVHIDMDLLIADVQSLQILLRDLAAAYMGEQLPAVSKDFNFSDYLERQADDDKDEKENAKKYWESRLKELPGGPELPLRKRPEEIGHTEFFRRSIKIEKHKWDRLQKKAADYKTTPAMVLLTAYAAILERWSENKRFLINIPFFNRKTEYQGLEEVIADFTTLLLLEVNCEEAPTFLELLERIQKQLHRDMKYTVYSGVQVQRDLAQLRGEHHITAPVVFACNLGTPLVTETFRGCIGEFSYMISQTPQVWNDFQSYEDESGLLLTWDTVDELFPAQMIQNMMDSFGELLDQLEEEDWNQVFDVLPETEKNFIQTACQMKKLKNPECLHSAFLKCADRTPHRIAVVDTENGFLLTYKELKEQSMAAASAIIQNGITGEPIAVSTERGHRQIIAVLGILISGNCYVPISENQPYERRKLIYEKTGIRFIISDQMISSRTSWPEETKVLLLDELLNRYEDVVLPEISPFSTAYIIMTSGSTGTPKGVEIAHYSAWNTIKDINEKYEIGMDDSVLSVSALDFDLSVYDIFGLLGCGGRVALIPEEEKNNSEYWLKAIQEYHITVWNSVPILLEMLLTTAGEYVLPFKIVIASGDWISLKLPEKVKENTKACRFIAMGGATEGSIWSNFQEVTLPIPEHWKSIPYGKPLSNQTYRIVSDDGRDCPVWTAGELWIGGCGVAKGYKNDTPLTAEKFIKDSLGRWYRTGDKGRYWPDHTIEFLGRKDNQVKIKGHRIEVGEIENCLEHQTGIHNAVVIKKGSILKAYIELDEEVSNPLLAGNEAMPEMADEDEKIKNMGAGINICEQLPQAEKIIGAGTYLACKIIYEIKLFPEKDKSYTLLELMKNGRIIKEFAGLIAYILKTCIESGVVTCSEETFRLNYLYNTEKLTVPLELKKSIDASLVTYCSVLQGKISAAELLLASEYQLTPQALYMKMRSDKELSYKREKIRKIISAINGNIAMLEIGSRICNWTDSISDIITNKIQYTLADSHKYFVDQVKNQYHHNERINVEVVDFNDELWRQGMENHTYKCIISNNSLHRFKNIDHLLKNLYKVLLPGGFLIFTESVRNNALSTISISIFENGYEGFDDFRKITDGILISAEDWTEHLESHGFSIIMNHLISQMGDEILIVARKDLNEKVLNKEKLKNQLMQELPYYMIPEKIIEIDSIPISSNGKVDRKALMNCKDNAVVQQSDSYVSPETDIQKTLVKIWEEILEEKGIGINDKFLKIGGDSLKATQIINKLKGMGFETSLKSLYEAETIREYSKNIVYKFGAFTGKDTTGMDCGEI